MLYGDGFFFQRELGRYLRCWRAGGGEDVYLDQCVPTACELEVGVGGFQYVGLCEEHRIDDGVRLFVFFTHDACLFLLLVIQSLNQNHPLRSRHGGTE